MRRLEAFELKIQQRTVIGGVEVKVQAKFGKGAVTRVKWTRKRKCGCRSCMRQVTHTRRSLER